MPVCTQQTSSSDAPQPPQPQPQPPSNGSSHVGQTAAQQPQPAVLSPLPQQVQQLISSSSSSSSSGISTSNSTPSAIQPPQFPPGVKVPLSVEQPTAAQSQQALQAPGMQRPPSAVSQHQQAPSRPSASAFPGSLSDLVSSFETVKQKGECCGVPCGIQLTSRSSPPHDQPWRSTQALGRWLLKCPATY